jgi:hypothetical protein
VSATIWTIDPRTVVASSTSDIEALAANPSAAAVTDVACGKIRLTIDRDTTSSKRRMCIVACYSSKG